MFTEELMLPPKFQQQSCCVLLLLTSESKTFIKGEVKCLKVCLFEAKLSLSLENTRLQNLISL